MPKLKIIFLSLAIHSGMANAFCFEQAGAEYKIDPLLLKAIAIHESMLRPGTISGNSNHTYDIGLMGINSVHLRDSNLIRAGYSSDVLLDPCTNVRVGAWLLRKKIERWGETWWAVGAYHSETPERSQPYQWLIFRAYQRLKESLTQPKR